MQEDIRLASGNAMEKSAFGSACRRVGVLGCLSVIRKCDCLTAEVSGRLAGPGTSGHYVLIQTKASRVFRAPWLRQNASLGAARDRFCPPAELRPERRL